MYFFLRAFRLFCCSLLLDVNNGLGWSVHQFIILRGMAELSALTADIHHRLSEAHHLASHGEGGSLSFTRKLRVIFHKKYGLVAYPFFLLLLLGR